MNIKEIEELSGLTRANIRFYEKVGLVIPERKENGYRNYSDKNLEELKRIRLFRELEVPIDKIKELQNSPEVLERVMRQHIVSIEQQMKHLQDAIAVCKDIQLTKVSYNNINVEQYLEKLRQLEINMVQSQEKISSSYQYTDIVSSIPHPVVRYVARSVDFLIYQLLLLFIWNVLFRQISGYGAIESIIRTLAATVFMLFLEPLFISLFRTTPGKRIFGITLNSISGEKLSYKDAFLRTEKVIFWGLGWNIPLLSLYRLYKSYGQCVESQSMEWDFPYIVDYQIPERTYVIPALNVVFHLFLSFLVFYGITLYELTPPNKGNLTLEEYVENYNYYVRYYAIKSNNRADSQNSGFLGDDGQIISKGIYILDFGGSPEIQYEYKYDGEYITGVSFTKNEDIAGFLIFDGYVNEMVYSIMAFTAAQEHNIKIKDLFEFTVPANLSFRDYNVTFGDVTASCDVTFDKSLFIFGNYYRIPKDEGPAQYDISFKITN